MASPALRFGRWSQTGNVYAITAVTRARRPWFDDKANVDLLIEALRTVERTGRTSSLAWVVMPDHLHWLFELRTGTLAGCMQILKSRSGRSIARRADANAPIWQPGYYDHALRCAAMSACVHRRCTSRPIRCVQGWPRASGSIPMRGVDGCLRSDWY